MSKSEFNKLKANVGGLLSITNFFSTSASRQVALIFAGDSDDELIAIVFEIHLNSSTSTSSPFVCIENLSHFGDVEHEWLFSMGSVFRIGQIEQCEGDKHYTVHITPSNEQDKELNRLSKLIQPKLQIPNPMAALGVLLIEMGKNDMAAAFYETALRFDMEPIMRSSLLVNLGECYINLEQYDKALIYLRQSLEIKLQLVPSNHWSLGTTYNQLGTVYTALGQKELGFKFYEQAMEIELANENPDYNKIATRILNLGSAYFEANQKQKARSYYERAASIMLEHLPPNHPNLAVVYNSLSTIYYVENNLKNH
jgi:tetratricopeptide (TPR) repeat protein